MPPFMSESETTGQARRVGELEGSAFAAALLSRERAERLDRLSRIALRAEEADLPAVAAADPPRREHAETESRLRELSQFHDAVTNSRSWKWMQRVRGLVGRAW